MEVNNGLMYFAPRILCPKTIMLRSANIPRESRPTLVNVASDEWTFPPVELVILEWITGSSAATMLLTKSCRHASLSDLPVSPGDSVAEIASTFGARGELGEVGKALD